MKKKEKYPKPITLLCYPLKRKQQRSSLLAVFRECDILKWQCKLLSFKRGNLCHLQCLKEESWASYNIRELYDNFQENQGMRNVVAMVTILFCSPCFFSLLFQRLELKVLPFWTCVLSWCRTLELIRESRSSSTSKIKNFKFGKENVLIRWASI